MARDWESAVHHDPHGVDVSKLFRDLHSDGGSAQYEAAAGIYWLARLRPDRVAGRAEELFSSLDGTSDVAIDDGSKWIGKAFGVLAAEYPDRWLRPLVDLLDTESPTGRVAARGLVETANLNPRVPTAHSTEIGSLLDESESDRRNAGIAVLRGIASEYPNRVRPFVPRIVYFLDDDATRNRATEFIAILSRSDPTLLRAYIPSLLDHFERAVDDDPFVHPLLIDALASLGSRYPDELNPAIPTARRVADSDDPGPARMARELLDVLDA